jgi:hypothetical protein
MLCGIGLRFNLLRNGVLAGVSDKRSLEDRELPVGPQSTKALGCFHHAGSRTAQRHLGISPSLHVVTDATNGAHHVLDSVGAGERAPRRCRKAEPINSHHLVEPCPYRSRVASLAPLL